MHKISSCMCWQFLGALLVVQHSATLASVGLCCVLLTISVELISGSL